MPLAEYICKKNVGRAILDRHHYQKFSLCYAWDIRIWLILQLPPRQVLQLQRGQQPFCQNDEYVLS